MGEIKSTKIMSEERRIKMLVLGDGTMIQNCPEMRIIPYEENGQMAAVVWFKVAEVGLHTVVTQRINSAYVQQIIYEEY